MKDAETIRQPTVQIGAHPADLPGTAAKTQLVGLLAERALQILNDDDERKQFGERVRRVRETLSAKSEQPFHAGTAFQEVTALLRRIDQQMERTPDTQQRMDLGSAQRGKTQRQIALTSLDAAAVGVDQVAVVHIHLQLAGIHLHLKGASPAAQHDAQPVLLESDQMIDGLRRDLLTAIQQCAVQIDGGQLNCRLLPRVCHLHPPMLLFLLPHVCCAHRSGYRAVAFSSAVHRPSWQTGR